MLQIIKPRFFLTFRKDTYLVLLWIFGALLYSADILAYKPDPLSSASSAVTTGAVLARAEGSQPAFSPQELAYLARKKVLKMCVDPNWMPYEQISKTGTHQGLAADYMALFRKNGHFKTVLVKTENWQQSLDFVRTKRCDFLPMAKKTLARASYLNFTRPYIAFPVVVATTLDKFYFPSLSRELDKTFSVVKGYSVVEYLRQQYPGIRLIEVENIEQGLALVNTQQAYGYIDSLLSISYAIKNHQLLNIKISGDIDFQSAPSVATRIDEPLLQSIFQKSIDAISAQEQQIIDERWMSVIYEKSYNYQLIGSVIGVGLAIIGIILIWNRKLASAHREVRETLNQLQLTREILEQKNQQLEILAVTDKLTGLFNRLRLDHAIEESILAANQQAIPFSVILLDIDYFKTINDRYGHQIGDQVLIELSQLLTSCSRSQDTLARWGGEEFMLLCSQTDQQALAGRCAEIHTLIQSHSFADIDKCTLSIGAAAFKTGDTHDSIVNRADKALYWVKNNGRNQVKVSDR